MNEEQRSYRGCLIEVALLLSCLKKKYLLEDSHRRLKAVVTWHPVYRIQVYMKRYIVLLIIVLKIIILKISFRYFSYLAKWT